MELSRLGVTAAYISFKEGHTQPLAFDELQTTDGNRFLVEGADDEIVFLVNNTGQGNAIRDLHGDIVFDDGKATVCLPHPNDFDRFTFLQVALELKKKGARAIFFLMNRAQFARWKRTMYSWRPEVACLGPQKKLFRPFSIQ
jgi:hypothetical protein